MAYQLSEKNQILVALFAIVVLCAGKLFKDYLYRSGYIEGLTVVPVTDSVLRRSATNDLTGVTLYLNLTLGAGLASGQTITVTWPSNNGVNTTTNASDYSVSGITASDKTITSVSNNNTLTITNSAQLNTGSKIKITIANVTITRGDAAIYNFAFTVTAGSESPVATTITVLAPSDTGMSENTSAQEIRTAIASINARLATTPNDEELLKARSALVNVLAYTYGTVKEAGKVFDSDALYEAQKTAINFIQKEKARAAANAQTLSQDNANKRRMAQLNTYYTRNYEANTEVMKNIIYVSIVLIVIAVLRNKELIPASISTLGVIFTLTMGGIVIGKQVFDIMRRNDHDFDKYDWKFNEDDMNNKFVQQNPDSSTPMELGLGASCYGPGCCDAGTTWDEGRGRCASSGGTLSSQGSSAVWGNGALTITMKISQALASPDTINISLPSGLFTSGSNATIMSSAIASSPVTKTAAEIASEITLPVATAGVSGSASVTISISGITISPSADLGSFQNVNVSTSKEPRPISLRISGLV